MRLPKRCGRLQRGGRTVYLDRLSTLKFREHAQLIDTVVLPVGSVEAHGYHCPLGTDNMIPAAILQQVEAMAGKRLFIAPAIPYGHTWELSVYPGTINVSAGAFSGYVSAVGQEFVRWGLKNVVILNGHGGNIGALTTAAEAIAEAAGPRGGGRCGAINWWIDFSQEILTVCETQGHAGEDETSVLRAIDDGLVDMKQASNNTYKPVFRYKETGIGNRLFAMAQTGDARTASAEKGQKILGLVARRVVELAEALREGK